LLLVVHRKPLLYQDDAGADEHLFKKWASMQEFLTLIVRAEPHHSLDTSAVVPTPIEQNDFAGRR
jgi:hypothetical protein